MYLPETGITLAHLTVDQKTNEITVVPTLLAELDLTGMVVTGDAMQCQQALNRQILDASGEYLWVVKENQLTLLADSQAAFAPPPPALPGWPDPPLDMWTACTIEAGHGRIDERILRATTMLADDSAWPHIAQVLEITRMWTDSAGRTHTATRYAVTSLPAKVVSAERLMELMRGHWRSENELQYRRDVTLQEDASLLRRGRGPAVLAAVNNGVIGLAWCASTGNALWRRCIAASCVGLIRSSIAWDCKKASNDVAHALEHYPPIVTVQGIGVHRIRPYYSPRNTPEHVSPYVFR